MARPWRIAKVHRKRPHTFVALEEAVSHTVEPNAEVVDVFSALQNTPSIQDAFAVVGTTTAELIGLPAEVRIRETNLGRHPRDHRRPADYPTFHPSRTRLR